jgi:hypothetical protein
LQKLHYSDTLKITGFSVPDLMEEKVNVCHTGALERRKGPGPEQGA